MNKIAFVLILQILLSSFLISENEDGSISDTTISENQKRNIKDTLDKYDNWRKITDPDTRNFVVEAIEHAHEIGYVDGIIRGNRILAIYFSSVDRNDTSLHYFFNALEYCKVYGLEEESIELSRELSNQLWKIGDYADALEYALVVEKSYEENNKNSFNLYNLIALIYRGLKDYNSALEYSFRAKNVADDAGNKEIAAVITSNIGCIYFLMNEFKKAIEYVKEGVLLEEKYNLTGNAGRSYVILARISLKLSQIEEAEYYVARAFELNKKVNDRIGFIRTYNTYGELYIAKQDYGKATESLLKAIELGTEIEVDDELMDSYKLISSVYAQTGNYKLAYDYKNKFFEMYSIIHNPEKLANTKRLEFELMDEKRILQLTQIELEKQRTASRLFSVITLLSLIIISLLVYSYQSLRRQKKTLLSKNIEIDNQKKYLESLNKKLNKAIKRAEESDKLKSHFLRNISHEIRTPLNGILGFSEIITNESITQEEKEKYLQLISDNGNDLISMIDNLVDMAHISTDQIDINPVKINVPNFMLELKDYALHKIDDMKKSHINFHIDINDVEAFYSDKFLLKKVMNHLVDNAVKFTKKGEIFLSSTNINEHVEFVIRDTGIGISEKNQEVIFDSFRQEQENLTREYYGSGLGLSISKHLIELLKGKIWVTSEKNIGSEFHIKLPKEL